MLCIIFTKKKLLAGVQADTPQLLQIKGRSHLTLDSGSATQTLEANLEAIGDAYIAFAQKNGMKKEEEIPTALAFPVDVFSSPERQKIQALLENAKNKRFKFVHAENLVVSFIYGVNEQAANENVAVIESLDDFTHLCYHLKKEQAEKPDLKELGSKGLFTNESFEFFPYKDFGFSSGSEKVLNELMTEFLAAGLTIDFKGQTQLAKQLETPSKDHRYNVSKNTDSVSLEAEVRLNNERYYELLTTNKEKVGNRLVSEGLGHKRISRVVLLGNFLKNDGFQSYLEKNLNLGTKLLSTRDYSQEKEFASMIAGLTQRANQVLEADRIRTEELDRRRMEAEKRAKIAAELKVKKDRESLLREIQMKCIDPGKQSEYESDFIEKGVALGIPEVVIRWNITEVLGKIELKKEGEGVGLEIKDEGRNDAKEDIKKTPSEPEIAVENREREEEKEKGIEMDTDKPDIEKSPSSEPAVPENPVNEEDVFEVEIKEEAPRVMPEANKSADPVLSGINTSLQSDNKPNILHTPVAVADAKLELKKETTPSGKVEPAMSNGISTQTEAKPNGIVEEKKENKEEPEPVEKPDLREEAEEAKPLPRVESKVDPKPSPTVEPVLESKPEPKSEPELQPVLESASGNKKEPEAEIKVESKANLVPEDKVDPGKKSFSKKEKTDKSLSDIFTIKGALPDSEFSTKKVIMNGESEPKVVRVLGVKDSIDPGKVARFRKLYEKEVKYYLEISEISEASEGLYYYRNYLERTTLKDYVKKAGLDTKLDIDSLSSTDLKFILQVFKEVRELPVGHANLTEDNILVISKRKWNLQKNVEIKFVGFTVEDATADEMVEKTHEIFSGLLGKAFYKDFREKFQL